MPKEFEVTCEITFEGIFVVKAENEEEAEHKAKEMIRDGYFQQAPGGIFVKDELQTVSSNTWDELTSIEEVEC